MTIRTATQMAALVVTFMGLTVTTALAQAAAAKADAQLAADLRQVNDAVKFAQARELIDSGRFTEALAQLDDMLAKLDQVNATRGLEEKLDAAMYWRAYSLSKQGEYADALSALDDLQRKFAKSGWLKDAKALELELRQATGQAVSPDAQPDEELKLLALRGLMQTDPERAVPMIEQLLAGDSSTRVKENAIFVLSQSRSARAREILSNVARGTSNPDLQLRAVRYLGVAGDADSRRQLAEIYRATSDAGVKRAVLRSFMVSRAVDELNGIARSETDRSLQRDAIRNLGLVRSDEASAALRALYTPNASPEVRKDVINAMFLQQNAAGLVQLARTETDPALKREIVSKLSLMKSPEATDYLLELLK